MQIAPSSDGLPLPSDDDIREAVASPKVRQKSHSSLRLRLQSPVWYTLTKGEKGRDAENEWETVSSKRSKRKGQGKDKGDSKGSSGERKETAAPAEQLQPDAGVFSRLDRSRRLAFAREEVSLIAIGAIV
jgi:hypothetical protein